MNYKFSVLLSVYHKEDPTFLKESIESIYFSQTLKPDEIILVEDGPLNEELYEVIDDLEKRIGKNIFKTLPLEKNMGLGNALNRGLLKCENEYVMRMDTDDIAYPERFEKQMKYMKDHPEVDVLGSYMSEFTGNIDNIICLKTSPSNDTNMKKYMRFRDPVNHPSVLFKKSKVLEAGNYKEIFLNEDSYLWARMLANNCVFNNIEEPLVYFRVSDDTYQRRGGWKYVKAEWKLQKEYLRLGLINNFKLIVNMILKGTVRLVPNDLRKILYLKLLRK